MPFPTLDPLTTERVLIHTMHESDLDDLLEINSDPQVTTFLPYDT